MAFWIVFGGGYWYSVGVILFLLDDMGVFRGVIVSCVSLCVRGWTAAVSWSEVLDVEYVSRTDWGADESWRQSDSFANLSPRPTSSKTKSIIQYLVKHHASELALDSVISHEHGGELYRPLRYKQKKKGIVIHHTASSTGAIAEQGGIVPHIQNIYKYHTFKRRRGDIGYNFLIDEDGVIYEGRAGGVDIVGAHVAWNNNELLGISLIGNFQEKEPTPAMVASLKRLTASLALYYDIDPESSITAHQTTKSTPYIQDIQTHSIAGHKDIGHTTCPGSHVYALLPELRDAVSLAFLHKKYGDHVSLHHHLDPVLIDGIGSKNLRYTSSKSSSIQGTASCSRKDKGIPLTIQGCRINGNTLSLDVEIAGRYVSGSYPLWVEQGSHRELRYVETVRSSALGRMLYDRKNIYKGSSVMRPPSRTKNKTLQTLNDVQNFDERQVRVLLYEASMAERDSDYVSCQSICEVRMERDGSVSDEYVASTFSLVQTGGLLVTTSDTGAGTGDRLVVRDREGGWVSLDTYDRTSYAGKPWNRFVGEVVWDRGLIRSLDTQKRQDRYIIVNTLGIKDYLYGIGEAAVAEHPEKHKVVALLAKHYMAYYTSDDAQHPSLTHPDGVVLGYDAIDDPRSFQKYVGVGRLDVMPVWRDVIDETFATWITYDGAIPLLPYFNCSAGFTWSGQEKRGWTDTPHLASVVDFSPVSCKVFNGHGVGLSGRGAQYMATHGITHEQIIRYYYQGVDVSTLALD